MATKKTEPVTAPTNFDIWKQALTPEFIAGGAFITLSCGACPASSEACGKYDAACRDNFLAWAKVKAETQDEEVTEKCEN